MGHLVSGRLHLLGRHLAIGSQRIDLGIDEPSGGRLAGGNLAINTAIAARDQKLTAPVAVVSVYLVATMTMDTPSKEEDAAAKPLNSPMLV